MTTKQKSGRKPASEPTIGRQEIWTAIRKFDAPFTVVELIDASRAPRTKVADYLRCLRPAGIVSQLEDGRYKLDRDTGFHAPRLNRKGETVTQGAGVENMWRSMRMLMQFSWRDVAAHSCTPDVPVTEETARAYCGMLLKCGYLRVVQKASVTGRVAVYRLIRNSGPLPPMIQRVKRVYDPNTKDVFDMGEAE